MVVTKGVLGHVTNKPTKRRIRGNNKLIPCNYYSIEKIESHQHSGKYEEELDREILCRRVVISIKLPFCTIVYTAVQLRSGWTE